MSAHAHMVHVPNLKQFRVGKQLNMLIVCVVQVSNLYYRKTHPFLCTASDEKS
jgi:hypothetical protein